MQLASTLLLAEETRGVGLQSSHGLSVVISRGDAHGIPEASEGHCPKRFGEDISKHVQSRTVNYSDGTAVHVLANCKVSGFNVLGS